MTSVVMAAFMAFWFLEGDQEENRSFIFFEAVNACRSHLFTGYFSVKNIAATLHVHEVLEIPEEPEESSRSSLPPSWPRASGKRFKNMVKQ
jgi:hypothetical protein